MSTNIQDELFTFLPQQFFAILQIKCGTLQNIPAHHNDYIHFRKLSSQRNDYKKKPDCADMAYREAVSRLRILLAESYAPKTRYNNRDLDNGAEETDNQSLLSVGSKTFRMGDTHYRSSLLPISRRYTYYDLPTRTVTDVVDPQRKLDR